MLQLKDIEWLNGYKTHICAAYKRLTSNLKRQRPREGMEKGIHANGNQKKAEAPTLNIRQNQLYNKDRIGDKGGHYVTTKGSLQEQ